MATESEGRVLLQGTGRALGGALLFASPIFMTMEVWQLGLVVPRYRLALLTLATVVLVLLLTRFFGATTAREGWRGIVTDAGIAVVMAAVAATLVLTALAVLSPLPEWRDALSVLAIELLPAAVGASYARGQLGRTARPSRVTGYADELLLMVAGAVVFSANIAPTEEVVLLAARTGPWHALALVGLSLALMHGFVYSVGFKGQEAPTGGVLRTFVVFTVVGYVLTVAVSAYLLWTFGRLDGTGAGAALTQCVVLALPGSLGAAAARLVL
ncbi:TIGR02587 family membrane protein [Geodermatophilus sp. SYSU D01106]